MNMCKKDIIDDQIVDLYNNGWSINDIIAHYRASVKRVRAVLQDRGLETSSYRAISEHLKDRLLAVVVTGLSLREIEETIDFSSHLIRQVLRDKQVTATEWRLQSELDLAVHKISKNDWNRFVALYTSGERGFIQCADQCGFSPRDCAEAVLRLSDKEVKEHREKLYKNVFEQRLYGLSAISVSKQLGVSPSLVKKIFANQL